MRELPIKNEFASGLLELSRLASSEYVTGSRRLTSRPCWVCSVVIDPTDPAAVTHNYLRNGEVVTSPILIGLGAQFAHPTHCSCIPVYFNRGLYIEVGANTDGVIVQYLVDSP